MDNLRIYLIIAVILVHASIAYGGVGDWPVRDPAVDDVSPLFLTIFNAVNQSYFMSAFFLLAGYFTPRSLERKGSTQFLKERVTRLVIPLIFYPILIAPINEYLIRNFMLDHNVSIWTIIVRRMIQLDFGVGHLWFLQTLLVFAIIYVIYRVLANRSMRKPIQLYTQIDFPPTLFYFSVLEF